jgi:hypothetical protein
MVATPGGSPITSAPRFDNRVRFAWLDMNRACVIYQGDECLINVGTRKTPFRGETLTRAVNAAMEAIPPARGATK